MAIWLALVALTQAGETTPVVNVNEATVEQLQHLPGIGKVLAGRIRAMAAYEFLSGVEELILVKGIGEKTADKMLNVLRSYHE